MHLHAKPPALVPQEHSREIEKLSKAALMDMVWSFSVRCAGTEDADTVMSEFRREREAVEAARR